MKRTIPFAFSIAAVLGMNSVYADTIFCVHDKDLNDSQLCAGGNFAEDTPTPALHKMGPIHKDCDIEALDVVYDPGDIYAASGDDTPRRGRLYKVNRVIGKVGSNTTVVDLTLDDLGGVFYTGTGGKSVKLKEIDGIAADPDDGTLWGWAQKQGLFKIIADPLSIPVVNKKVGDCIVADPANDFVVEAKMIVPTSDPMEIEDIEWNEDGEVLYGVENVHDDPVDSHGADEDDAPSDRDYEHGVRLWAYASGGSVQQVCTNLDFSLLGLGPVGKVPEGEVEGLDSLPRSFFDQPASKDILVLTFHGSDTLPFVVLSTPVVSGPPGPCAILYAGGSIAAKGQGYALIPGETDKYELVGSESSFNDIEGIAYGPTTIDY